MACLITYWLVATCCACWADPAGGSVVHPSLVQELFTARRRRDPLDILSPRERDVLALTTEGASKAGIASRIFVTENTVQVCPQHLDQAWPATSETENRWVLAVLRFLEAR